MRNPIFSLVDAWTSRRAADAPSVRAAIGDRRPVAVVTGGSLGIGLAFAHRLARAGHEVVLVARRPEPLTAAAAAIGKRAAQPVHTLSLDVVRADAPSELERQIAAMGAYVDILVNNAGIGAAGPFAEGAAVRLAGLVDLNVCAPTMLMRQVLPGMLARGRGGVINVASLGGLVPGPNQAAYYASKAYLISLSEAVAAEVAGRGIRVCCVAPGPADTRFHAAMGADNALYRWLMLPTSPARIASAGYLGFRLGRRLVVPGIANKATALALKLLPHRLLSPLIAVLLRPR